MNFGKSVFAQNRLKAFAPVLLVWSCLVLLPFARSVELPVLIMAIGALVLIVRRGPGWLWTGGNRVFSLLFLVWWLPMLLALPDALAPAKSAADTFGHLRLYLAGLFVIHALSTPERWTLFLRLAAYVLLFWIGDALIQAVLGFDVLGYAANGARINGIFGEGAKLGPVLPVLSPLLVVHVQRAWPGWARALVYLALAAVVLLSGSRAGWVAMSVVTAAFFGWHCYLQRRVPWRQLLAAVLAAVGLVAVLYQVHPGVHARVAQSMLVLQGTAEAVNAAGSSRLVLWRNAVEVIAEHPLNGVGPSGFRYAYLEVAGPDDPFISADSRWGAYHTHQLLLEVASETGALGLIGLLLFYALCLRLWLRASRAQRQWLLPAGICVLAALFPLNSHHAIYNVFLSQLVWWLTALYCAAAAVRAEPAAPEPAAARAPARA